MGRLLNYANAAAYVVNILIIFIVGQSHKIGKTNSEVSAAYPTLFTPAGWAFSIWGLIFTLEALFAVYQLTSSVRDTDAVQKGVGVWWIVMVAAQAGWSFSFSLESIPLSMAFMLVIFVSLRAIVLGLRKHLPAPNAVQRLCLTVPFSLNYGWISAATLANANIVAVYRDSADFSSQLAVAACSLVVAGLLALIAAVITEPGDAVYCLVLVWASTAISRELASPKAAAIQQWPSYVTGGLSQAAAAVAFFSAAMALYAFASRPAAAMMARRSSADTQNSEPSLVAALPASAPPKPKSAAQEALLRT